MQQYMTAKICHEAIHDHLYNVVMLQCTTENDVKKQSMTNVVMMYIMTVNQLSPHQLCDDLVPHKHHHHGGVNNFLTLIVA